MLRKATVSNLDTNRLNRLKLRITYLHPTRSGRECRQTAAASQHTFPDSLYNLHHLSLYRPVVCVEITALRNSCNDDRPPASVVVWEFVYSLHLRFSDLLKPRISTPGLFKLLRIHPQQTYLKTQEVLGKT
jgi:hypothetical protein